MRYSLVRYALAVIIILNAIGCSAGDLSRSEAKKKLSQTTDMCDPCFLALSGAHPLAKRLILMTYVNPTTLQLTPLGRHELGETSILSTPLPPYANEAYIGAFKKEIEEVTGIAMRGQDTAEVQFKYRIIPILGPVRDAELALETLKINGFYDLSRVGTAEQSGGKLVAFHTTGTAFLRFRILQQPCNRHCLFKATFLKLYNGSSRGRNRGHAMA
jgi:hypothetical protein